jgi:hypothetical protein
MTPQARVHTVRNMSARTEGRAGREVGRRRAPAAADRG